MGAIIIGLAGLLLAVFLIVICARRLSRPIKCLSDTAARIADGDLSARADVEGGREMAILGETFNIMIQRLHDSRMRLEQTVVQRTTELEQSNKKLRSEIDSRHQIEEALRKSEMEFRALFEFSPQSIMLTEAAGGRIIDVNNKFCQSIGKEKDEIIGRTTIELGFFTSQYRQALIDQLREAGEVYGMEKTILLAEGKSVNVLIYARLLDLSDKSCVLTIITDITEYKMLENKLLQSRKMEAIGTLAAGIAHDFNNILNSIFGYVEVMKRDLQGDDKTARNLQALTKAGRRAASLIHQILTFSRQADQTKAIVQLQVVIDDVVGMLKGTLPAAIKIQPAVDPECKGVLGDDTQLHQVVMNLCTNALQAMHDQNGILSIELKQVTISSMMAESKGDLDSGQYARLRVMDTGPGIDDETINKIFDPYFSSRPTGDGTGLGLAMVHGIVKSHGGVISCKSEVGKGALFELYLPIIEDEVIVVQENDDAPPEFKGRILYVDDEIANKQIWEIAFKQIGCQVVAETDCEEALRIFRQRPDDFDVVITDQSMPTMTGMELAREILKIRSDIPVILSTGYDNTANESDYMKAGIKGFIKKPHSMEDMLKVIAMVTAAGEEESGDT